MDYHKIYADLMVRGVLRELRNEAPVGEVHHILPRAFGGADDPTNLVKLSFREHFIAHRLLVKISTTPRERLQMASALRWLCKSNHGKRIVSSRMFEISRSQTSLAQILFRAEIIGPNGETRGVILARKFAPLKAKQEIYEWFHELHGVESCNCYQLSLKYNELNGRSSNLLKVATENRPACNGWILLKNKGRDFKAEKRLKMSDSAKKRGSNGNQFKDRGGNDRL